MRILMLAATLLTLTGSAAAQSLPKPDVAEAALQVAVVDVIRPGMTQLSNAAEELDRSVADLCSTPSDIALSKAHRSFGALVSAYGRVAFLRLGPVLEHNRLERLLFWPDRRGVTLRQVQAILSEQDVAATQVDSLSDKSVAVQGLTALEYVLYGTGSDTLADNQGQYRCAYGSAIARNIAEISGQLVEGWATPGGIADHLQRPQPSYTDFRTTVEALEALVGQVSHGTEALRDIHLQPFLASDGKSAAPKRAVFWRSGLTLEFIRSYVEGMRDLVTTTGLTGAVSDKDRWLENSVDLEFRNALRALDGVTLPLAEAVVDEQQSQSLRYLVLVTSSLQSVVGEQLSTALGLSVGFSSLDGD